MTNKVGLIGLGNAGLALATPIARKHEVIGYDVDPVRRTLASEAGVDVVASATDVAKRCDMLMLCLPNPEISRTVLEGLGREALSNLLIIENSTVGPQDIEALVEIAKPAGAGVMECAILGGVRKLTAGEGTFLVGGSPGDFERAKSVLDSAAEKIFYLGPLGNGMRTKLVCNAVAHAVMVVLVEAAALSAAQDIPMDVFYELMRRESGLMRPLTHRVAERIFKRDFDGGMSTANAHKDSALAMEVARDLGVPLFAISAAHTAYEIAMREGLERKDYSAMATLWEKWVGVSFAAK